MCSVFTIIKCNAELQWSADSPAHASFWHMPDHLDTLARMYLLGLSNKHSGLFSSLISFEPCKYGSDSGDRKTQLTGDLVMLQVACEELYVPWEISV